MGILNIKALKDWILLRGVNHMLATEKGFFMDARLGPVIQEELDTLKANVDEINSNLKVSIVTIRDFGMGTGTVWFAKSGNVVLCSASIFVNTVIQKGVMTKICDIPDDFKTAFAVIGGVVFANQHAVPDAVGIFQLDSEGLFINPQIDVPVNHRLYSNIVYVC